MEQLDQVRKALEIVGAEDFSSDGVEGRVDIDGEFAAAVIGSLDFAQAHAQRFQGKPVRLSRFGTLEIWIDGWYTEGKGVRKIVHQAAKHLHFPQALGRN